jgi:excisionase family DNA binding protein
MSQEIDKLFNSKTAAHMLNIGTDTLRALARAKRISHRRVGRLFWFSQEDLAEYTSGSAETVIVKAMR